MPSSHRKVIVRRFAGDLLPGYLPSSQFVEAPQAAGALVRDGDRTLQLLDLSGKVVPVRLGEVKMVCYVRDFNLPDTRDPERLNRRSFLARPRGEGLWVRVTFRSGDLLDGLAPTDLSFADDLLNDRGIQLIPPDTRSNTQRVYIPRSAMTELQVLAVVTSRTRPLPTVPKDQIPDLQEQLFQPAPSAVPSERQEP